MARVQITLTTVGRRSGEPRPVTLYAFDDGGDLVIVGSKGGAATDPHWAGNLRATPRATVRRGKARTTIDVFAREVEGDGPQRDRLWALVCEGFPLYATYQRKTTRQFPLLVLEPVAVSPP